MDNVLRNPKDVIINERKLSDILSDHLHWLKEDVDGWRNMRADLSGADLKWTHLSGVNLRWADLSEADLRGADLSEADLRGANLIRANLSGANLSETSLYMANLGNANLNGANLIGADMSGAILFKADLGEASLRCANLGFANLNGANLGFANLNGANLSGANLYKTNLSGVNLSNAILPDDFYYPMVCPEERSFIGYKKALLNFNDDGNFNKHCIVELSIPEDALRSSATSRKCRCDKAKVLAIYDLDHNKLDDSTIARSYYYNNFEYKVGKEASVSDFDTDRWNECSTGIHFFINFREAVEYILK